MRKFAAVLAAAAVVLAATPVHAQPAPVGGAASILRAAAPLGYARVDRFIEPNELGVARPGLSALTAD